MKIFKKLMDWLNSDPVKALGKEHNFTGSGIDTQYAAEIPPIAQTTSNCIRYRKRAQTAEHKLRFASEALKAIAHLTKNNLAIPPKYREATHKIASDGYEAAK